LGDGTGGQSIWGSEFEDEFHKRYFICCFSHRCANRSICFCILYNWGSISSLATKFLFSTLLLSRTHVFILLSSLSKIQR
jgi:hypothetical protein